MGSDALLIVGTIAAVGITLNFVRMWLLVSTVGGRARASRIADSDAHLSFDERIAQRLRELEKESGAETPITPPQGFGRRGT
jgi:hypothetical protein